MWRLLIRDRDSLESRRTQEMLDLAVPQSALEPALFSARNVAWDTSREESDRRVDGILQAILIAGVIELWLDGTAALVEPEAILYPDDPHMRWLRTEFVLGPERAERFYSSALIPIARDMPMSETARLNLLQAVASLGKPPLERAECALGGVFTDPLSEAVLRSRTCVPCSDEHVAACQRVIESDRSMDEAVDIAITTLALLNKLDLVPQGKQLLWLTRQVSQATRPRRLRNLSEISRQPQGMKLLETQLGNGFFEGDAKSDVERVIAARKAGEYAVAVREE